MSETVNDSWLRRNGVLLGGIALPVVLVVGFLLLEAVPETLGDPPRHDFLVAVECGGGSRADKVAIDFRVRDGRLEGVAHPLDDTRGYYRQQRLYRYHVGDSTWERLEFQPPEVAAVNADADGSGISFAVPAASGLVLDGAVKAPDGYGFQWAGYRHDSGLLGMMFGMNDRRHGPWVLKRDNTELALPHLGEGNCYWGAEATDFVGWVVGGEVSS